MTCVTATYFGPVEYFCVTPTASAYIYVSTSYNRRLGRITTRQSLNFSLHRTSRERHRWARTGNGGNGRSVGSISKRPEPNISDLVTILSELDRYREFLLTDHTVAYRTVYPLQTTNSSRGLGPLVEQALGGCHLVWTDLV